jgi:exopolyphosphatase/guanosine-5'-triphosphate,3'-diphosphate pyrophosphatase
MSATSRATAEFADTEVVIGLAVADDVDGTLRHFEYIVPGGVATLGRRHIHHDPPLPEELTNAIGEMMDHVEDAKREIPALAGATEMTISGTVATVIAAVEIGGQAPDGNFVLSRDAAEDVFRTLATEAEVDRRHNPGLPAGSVSVIVAGCCAVVGLIRALHLDSVRVAAS